MNSSVYRHAVVGACSLGLLGLLAGCLDMSVSFESTNPNTSLPLSTEIPDSKSNPTTSVSDKVSNSTTNSHSANLSSKPVKLSNKTTPELANRRKLTGNAKYEGTLRMSNQTDQPVRLALLARQPLLKGSVVGGSKNDVPAHWDFAPQEGSVKGLILSLPKGNLKLHKGDILVAFAQDGSRRYWGPYIVGETSLPSWNAQNQEWLLVLGQ